jgi:hypothetical protein
VADYLQQEGTVHLYSRIQFVLKEDEMGGACSTHGRDEKCIQHFGTETWREDLCVDEVIMSEEILGK